MDLKEDIKNRLSIEDVIGSYVELKRAGRNWKGLSPFNPEKSPSFIVSPEKQIWHDFSSGKGGDMFSFVMEVEGLDFKEALELLARRANLDIDKYKKTGSSIDKKVIYDCLEEATRFYQVQLKNNQTALDYVIKQRGFDKKTLLEWRIGYAPNTGDALIKYLTKKGYSQDTLKNAGLIAGRYERKSDMFRGRVMIPLADASGRVIGYTARQLYAEDTGPKYLNTPQTVLYDKSRHIFGLHLAKEAIRKSNYVILVEGNLDVITAHQYGYAQVVATAGTALTIYHLKTVGRLTSDIRLCFDADNAGINATERAIELASKENIDLNVIRFGEGKDPDEIIRKDSKLWEEAINKPIYAIDWLIEYYKSKINISTAQGKRRFSSLLMPILNSLNDEVEKDHYLNILSDLLKVDPNSINNKLDHFASESPKKPLNTIKNVVKINKNLAEQKKIEDRFMAIILTKKTLRDFMQLLTPEMFSDPDSSGLFKKLKKYPQFDVKNGYKDFKNELNYVKILTLLYEELYAGLDLNELHYEASHLQTRIIETFIKNEKLNISEQLRSSDTGKTKSLLIRVKQLDELLNKIREASL